MTAAQKMEGGGGGRNKVAYLGPVASYSHQATKSVFSPDQKWELEPTVTIKEVFDVVQAGDADYGVIPFENSTHGTVIFTLNGLADRAGSYADLAVCGEIYLDVHHFLLGRRCFGGAAAGDASLKHIERVYSHPQAFGQTAAFFAKHLRGVDTIDVTSTSKAAELAAADTTGKSAAVAGEIAAETYALDVLAASIEDRDDNTTRFFVIRKGKERQEQQESSGKEGGDPYGNKHKSLLSFTVPHRTPGALADVLGFFKSRSLNLTSINSLPSLLEPFHYLFFVEFEGSRFDDPEGRVKAVFEDVERAALRSTWLGSWENQRRR
ncbi:prephenate dehydratase-like protein [Podospora didyma]|uniref:prephenate dehydratase n=1 Tax=Podospora didyma TaxID=330526 RepID=A0AAE0NA88_9PEZI|nr:prephenate dehydratase-like protein [Podospora didyma]